jgi:hypothetical protein
LFPAVLPKFAVYAYELPFDQVLVEGFALSAPDDNIEEISLVYPLISIFFPAVYRDGKFANSLTIGGIFKFSVSGQPSD